jgi:hypothetical protein
MEFNSTLPITGSSILVFRSPLGIGQVILIRFCSLFTPDSLQLRIFLVAGLPFHYTFAAALHSRHSRDFAVGLDPTAVGALEDLAFWDLLGGPKA